MVALYRAGRQTEALETFRLGRAALVEAFGLEPTPALKQLESRILLQDPALDGPDRAAPPPRATTSGRCSSPRATPPALDGLVAVGRRLAALGRHELLLTQVVEQEALLADGVAATRVRTRRARGRRRDEPGGGLRLARLRHGRGTARARPTTPTCWWSTPRTGSSATS